LLFLANFSAKVQDMDIVVIKANRNLYALYRMALFSMTTISPGLIDISNQFSDNICQKNSQKRQSDSNKPDKNFIFLITRL